MLEFRSESWYSERGFGEVGCVSSCKMGALRLEKFWVTVELYRRCGTDNDCFFVLDIGRIWGM